MLYFLIWVLIIAAVIWSERKKRSRKGDSGTRQQPNPRQRAQQSYQKPQPQNYRPGNPDTGQSMAAMTAKQRELKDRLTQRYGKPAGANRGYQGNPGMRQQGYQQRTAQKTGDILSRATANVRENEQDQLEMELAVRHPGSVMTRDAHDLVGAVDIAESSELMRQVNDLMIMGYQADLTFERDFVAEGIEMLNSYELSTGA